VEIRNDSFIDPDFVRLLKRYNTALVIADTAGNGRIAKTSPATSSTCACTVPKNSTPAATANRRCSAGPNASTPGTTASSPAMRT
jgi:hypothetical protein